MAGSPSRLFGIRSRVAPQRAGRADRDSQQRRARGYGGARSHRAPQPAARSTYWAAVAPHSPRPDADRRALGGAASGVPTRRGSVARRCQRRCGRPALLRAAHHEWERVRYHARGQPRHGCRGAVQLPRAEGRRPHPHRILSPLTELQRGRLQQRPPLHRTTRRPARLRGSGSPAERGGGTDLLTAHVPDDALDPRLLMRARGALLGLVIGNQLAVPTERLGTAKAIREAFPEGVRDLAPPPKGSPFDDDAAMTLLLAESLAEKEDFDARDVADRWVKWMKRDGRGIGLTTQRALRLIERGTEPFEAGRLARAGGAAASNGAVMRSLPVALRYHDNVDKMVRVSAQQAAVTHADERCTWGAAAVNLAARELLHGNQYFVDEVLRSEEHTSELQSP